MKINLTPARIKRLRPKSRDYMVWDARTPHFGIRVRTNGSMRFMHVIKIAGKTVNTTIGEVHTMTLEEAREIAVGLNQNGIGREKTKPAPYLADFVDQVWWPDCTARLKPSTLKGLRGALDRQILPVFGDMSLDTISRPYILNWFDGVSRKSPGAANVYLRTLNTILYLAVRLEIIPRNPGKKIRTNPRRKMTRFLSDEERAKLLEVLDKCPKQYQAQADIVRLLLFTGCRRGEILQLRWEEISGKVINLSDSKTGPRKVWLNCEALEVLERQPTRSGYVFPDPRDPNKCREDFFGFWKGVRSKAGIEDVRVHDLRHSFASHAIRQGVSLPVLQKLMGHSKLSMTMRYVHLSNADIEEASEQIGQVFMGIANG
jgi:integrase